MKMRTCFIFAVLFSFTCLTHDAVAEDKWTRLVDECGKVLSEVQEMPDQGIPEDLLRSCDGIAVIPSTISAGLGIGGQYGQGIIMARSPKGGWSSPAIFTLAGGSIGWQIGGQASDIVLLIMNRRSIDGILQGKFKLGADAAVSAGPVGRSSSPGSRHPGKGRSWRPWEVRTFAGSSGGNRGAGSRSSSKNSPEARVVGGGSGGRDSCRRKGIHPQTSGVVFRCR